MMGKLFVLILLILGGSLGCRGPKGDDGNTGPSGTVYPDYYNNFDPELRSLVFEYEAHLGDDADILDSFKLVPQIKVYRNGNLITGVIGVCRKYGDGTRTSEIESDYWWKAHRVQGKALGYHELAHCIQDAPHKSGHIGGTCTSMMNPYIPSAETLINCWDTMIDDLFDSSNALALDNHHDECYTQPDNSIACFIKGD